MLLVLLFLLLLLLWIGLAEGSTLTIIFWPPYRRFLYTFKYLFANLLTLIRSSICDTKANGLRRSPQLNHINDNGLTRACQEIHSHLRLGTRFLSSSSAGFRFMSSSVSSTGLRITFAGGERKWTDQYRTTCKQFYVVFGFGINNVRPQR